MRLITDEDELMGKTIVSAKFVDCSESLVIIFDDDTCIYIDINQYGECHDMVLSDVISMYDKWEAEIITQEDYDLYKSKEEADKEKKQRLSELNQLAKLKAKYETGD